MASFNNGDNYLTIRNLLNSTGLRTNNFSGSSAPGVSDDSSAGYEVGSLWLDTGNSVMYFAEDVSSGAASWIEVGTGAGVSSNYGDANVITLLSDIGSNTITTTGTITAGAFVGDGSGLTSLPSGAAQQLTWDSANSNLSISGGNTVTMFDQTLDSTDTVTFNQVNTPTLTTVENIYGPVAGTLLLDAGATAYITLSTSGSGVTVSSADGININNSGVGTINIGHSTNQTNFAGTVNFTSSTVTGIYDQSLNTTDDVTFNQVTAANVITTGVGSPVFDSASTITFDAPDGVIVQSGPLRLPSLSTSERNALTAANGDTIYNTTDSRVQSYQNGAWTNLPGQLNNSGVAYQYGYSAHNAVALTSFGDFTVNSVDMIISHTASANAQGARIDISGITASTSAGTGLIYVSRRINGGSWLTWNAFAVNGTGDHVSHSFVDFYDTGGTANDVAAGDTIEYKLTNGTQDTNYPGNSSGTVEFELFFGFQFTATEIPLSYTLTQP